MRNLVKVILVLQGFRTDLDVKKACQDASKVTEEGGVGHNNLITTMDMVMVVGMKNITCITRSSTHIAWRTGTKKPKKDCVSSSLMSLL